MNLASIHPVVLSCQPVASGRRIRQILAVIAVMAGLIFGVSPSRAADADAAKKLSRIGIELNKLEPRQGGACRIYLVVSSKLEQRVNAMKLDLVLFDSGGIIERRLVVNAAPIPPRKTRLKMFDLKGLACDNIGRMLLNDITDCQINDVADKGCLGRVDLSSRAAIEFVE